MKRRSSIFSGWHIVTSIFMVATLIWLTVSTPFVYAADQSLKVEKQDKNDDDSKNPFQNTTEEKSETGVTTLSEFLHEFHLMEQHFTILTKFYKCHPADLYFEFHPELVSPPPEA